MVNIIKIFRNLQEAIPNPTTDLVYHSNFELLIAVILSAQSTDKTINKATNILFKTANTPEKILNLKSAGLKKYIQTIGLYNTKAENILKTCRILIENFNSEVPGSREELESLPGVGRKTANVILNIAFNKPTIAVDTHVFRVANRTGIAIGKNPLKVENKLMKIVPTQYLKIAGNLLILHGRYTCTARNPKCESCCINKWCEYYSIKKAQ